MRIVKINEARRNPEVNNLDRKETTVAIVQQFLNKSENDEYPKYFISFREASKKPEHKNIEELDYANKNPDYETTPIGFYAFPITKKWIFTRYSNGRLRDFATFSSHYTVIDYDVKAHRGLIFRGSDCEFINTDRETILKKYRDILAQSTGDEEYATDYVKKFEGANDEVFMHKLVKAWLSGFGAHLKNGTTPQSLSKMYRMLGIDYVLCLNSNFIHGNEPYQICIIANKGMKVVKRGINRNKETPLDSEKFGADIEIEESRKAITDIENQIMMNGSGYADPEFQKLFTEALPSTYYFPVNLDFYLNKELGNGKVFVTAISYDPKVGEAVAVTPHGERDLREFSANSLKQIASGLKNKRIALSSARRIWNMLFQLADDRYFIKGVGDLCTALMPIKHMVKPELKIWDSNNMGQIIFRPIPTPDGEITSILLHAQGMVRSDKGNGMTPWYALKAETKVAVLGYLYKITNVSPEMPIDEMLVPYE